ncbi:bifunctional hydroxymethylpyrimidine kinase/phosphomethylpyrimidine kinase [Humidisolicoccus flavus]|uniref:bifunctional hydroxymethylpyrimidine kinase/phosphomethylpyrimidine kinase n=1 Tax=Humidisolicoccus flavus TaxID=3111414 RepID=UPI0032553D5D
MTHDREGSSNLRVPRVLSIAGTDPSGGAGIQADLKSIAANGGYGMAVVTALVAQNTQGVRSIHFPPTSFLQEQLESVSDDIAIDAVKIGMLGTSDIIDTVRAWLAKVGPGVVVLDPVMVATSGDRLLDAAAEASLQALLPLVSIVTPNIPELAVLLGESAAEDWETVIDQATRLSKRHGVLVLAKGGHLAGTTAPDALVDGPGGTVEVVHARRVATKNTHGTGCSLSAALASTMARTGSWPEALRRAKRWLSESLAAADTLDVGHGNGPIHHFAGLWERGGIETPPVPTELAANWWSAIEPLRRSIDECSFVVSLGNGSLPTTPFLWYLAQDALYLVEYARVLAMASALAPTTHEQAFWARGAAGAIEGELQLHEGWLTEDAVREARVHPSETTTAYLNHLRAAGSQGYEILIAALLPCYWLYSDIGARLVEQSHEGHPYASWLETYADEAFADATETAVEIVTTVAAAADLPTKTAMFEAFRRSAQHELAFFAAPLATGQRDEASNVMGGLLA